MRFFEHGAGMMRCALMWALIGCGVAECFAQGQGPIALLEMNNLVAAEEICFIDTNFFVSLENLDDLPIPTTPNHDFINDGGGAWVLSVSSANFLAAPQDLLTAFLMWQGPYVTYQSGRTDEADFFDYDAGTPLDLWGSPYYFFSPLGLVDPPNGITAAFYGDRFDRYAIVSFGPDGLFDSGDDLIVQFGSAPSQPTLSTIAPAIFAQGNVAEFHGYNLGAPGGNIELTFNGAPVGGGILSWTNTRIRKEILPGDPVGAVSVSLSINGNPGGLAIPITILPAGPFNAPLLPPAAARGWQLYP